MASAVLYVDAVRHCDTGTGMRGDTDIANGVVDCDYLTQHGRTVSRITRVDARDNRNAGGGEILVIKRPALLAVNESDSTSVGVAPSKTHINTGRGSVLVILIYIARVIGWIDGRRNRTSFHICRLNNGPCSDHPGDTLRLHAAGALDGIVQSEVWRRRRTLDARGPLREVAQRCLLKGEVWDEGNTRMSCDEFAPFAPSHSRKFVSRGGRVRKPSVGAEFNDHASLEIHG